VSGLRAKLLAINHLLVGDRGVFDSGQKVPDVLLEIATRLLLNIKSHDTVFVRGGRSFMYTFITDIWSKSFIKSQNCTFDR